MPYTLDDLSRFSPWPARLLNLEKFGEREKNYNEVVREFEGEKWGPLLKRYLAESTQPTLRMVDRWFMKDNLPVLLWEGERFKKSRQRQAHRRYLQLIHSMIRKYLPASTIAELGAGYGSVILRMKSLASGCEGKFLAGEFAPSGVKLLRLLAEREKFNLQVGRCDFNDMKNLELDIPPGAVIYTSYAAQYIKYMQRSFVTQLLQYKPSAVIHFEPLYEDCKDNSLLSLLRRRYIEVNGYNLNLKTLLESEVKNGTIRIIRDDPNVFGENPLLAASIIVWKPAN